MAPPQMVVSFTEAPQILQDNLGIWNPRPITQLVYEGMLFIWGEAWGGLGFQT